MKLAEFMAEACYYAQAHTDDAEVWSTEPGPRADYLQCTSYQMACFFAEHTVFGDKGVEWDVLIEELVEHPMKSENKWLIIIEKVAQQLGGWK